MLSTFIDCLCDGNKDGLVVTGFPTQAEIDAAWFGIYSEYIDISHNTDMKYSLTLQNNIVELKARIMRIDLCVRALRIMYDQEIVDILRNDYKFRYSFTSDTIEKDLNAVWSRSQKWDIQAQMKEAELEAYEKARQGEKPNRVYFITILTRLSDHAGLKLSPDNLTVAEFAVRKRDYVEYINQAKQHGRKPRTGRRDN